MKRTVYLAGPIAGLTEGQAKDWRNEVNLLLSNRTDGRIVGISPLRCEPAIDGQYDAPMSYQFQDPRFGTAKAIASKNDFDVRNCDMTLALLEDNSSIGTVIEVGIAMGAGKPVIVVSSDPQVRAHPLIMHCAGWILTDLEQAVDVIVGILEDYT